MHQVEDIMGAVRAGQQVAIEIEDGPHIGWVRPRAYLAGVRRKLIAPESLLILPSMEGSLTASLLADWIWDSYPYNVKFSVFGSSLEHLTYIVPHNDTVGPIVICIKAEYRKAFIDTLDEVLLAHSSWRRHNHARVFEPKRGYAIRKWLCGLGIHLMSGPQELPENLVYSHCECGHKEKLKSAS